MGQTAVYLGWKLPAVGGLSRIDPRAVNTFAMTIRLGKFSTDRPITSYSKIRRLIGTAIRGKRWLIDESRLRGKRYLNVGCGPNTDRRYINLDYDWHPDIDLCWDITRSLPISNERLDGIYSEHCLEHIPLHALTAVLLEFKRVLRPGGTARIVVPDGQLYLTRYTDIVRGDSGLKLPFSEGESHCGIYAPILSVNRIFREHGHLFIYDFELLGALLKHCGFVEVKREQFMTGRDATLQIDSRAREVESLYVEATRP
jgi:predicted SAM-dependent methyltransferase